MHARYVDASTSNSIGHMCGCDAPSTDGTKNSMGSCHSASDVAVMDAPWANHSAQVEGWQEASRACVAPLGSAGGK
eukprot:9166685-Alexandrium_andersonii.AAC.1